jgi:hypothetical protein
MAKKGRMTILKRQREVRKAEKAAAKREKREIRSGADADANSSQVATMDDLAAYGCEVEPAPPGNEAD